MSDSEDPARRFFRHCLATLAYRCRKAVANAPDGFGTFSACAGARTPVAILAHVADLVAWAESLGRGQKGYKSSTPGTWESETGRVFDSLASLESFLASNEDLAASPERLFQGPIADALTHVGQLAMLRRLAGAPLRGENYYRADIAVGRVGWDQAPAKLEFD